MKSSYIDIHEQLNPIKWKLKTIKFTVHDFISSPLQSNNKTPCTCFPVTTLIIHHTN